MSNYPAVLLLCIVLPLISCNRSDSRHTSGQTPPGTQVSSDARTNGSDLPAAAVAPVAQTRFITKSGKAEFTCLALGTVGIFSGESARLNGTLDLSGNLLEFSMELRTLKTGITRRDRDMYTLLGADRFPQIAFTGTFSPDFDPDSMERQPVTATGTFAMHGVDRELTVDGFLQRSGNSIRMEADFQIDIKDYGIEPPETFLVRVNGQPDIHISAHLVPQLLASNR